MPHSHHSHSGQFCPGHAHNSLEEMIQMALSKKLKVFGLSEHMPRHDIDQYPEEKEAGSSLDALVMNESAYFAEATRLRKKYASQINIPIGFECEWIRPESYDLIQKSITSHSFDYFIGSVHHVHTIPIDYDHQMYYDARDRAGGTDERLFQDYFDAQLDMLRHVKPPIVGHFDLIRLKSDNPNGSFKDMTMVWEKIIRNLDYVSAYGGILEINTAALRKGMDEPYPNAEICQLAVERNMKFCLSDDSHGTEQVAAAYDIAIAFLERLGIKELHYISQIAGDTAPRDERFRHAEVCNVNLADVSDDVCARNHTVS